MTVAAPQGDVIIDDVSTETGQVELEVGSGDVALRDLIVGTLEASVEARLGRVGGREPSRMGGDEVSLDLAALFGRFGEEVDMHLVRAAFRALVAQVSEIEARRLVAGLPEGERGAGSVLVAANEDVVGSRQGRAADQAIDAVEIAPSRSAAPIMEGLGEIGFGANEGWFIRKPPLRCINFYFARPHRIPTR